MSIVLMLAAIMDHPNIAKVFDAAGVPDCFGARRSRTRSPDRRWHRFYAPETRLLGRGDTRRPT